MTRREMLGIFGKLGILTVPFSSNLVRAIEKSSSELVDPEYVLIHDSTSSIDYRKLLARAGTCLAKRNSDWQQRLIILDTNTDEKKIRSFTDKYGRNTNSFSWPILIAVPQKSEEFEVETWTIEWLKNERNRYVDPCYPISGGWCSVDGDWNPTAQKVRNHVYRSPNHTGGKFESAWLELLKLAELQSLHSDHHREMIKEGKVYWKNVNKECPADRFSFEIGENMFGGFQL